MRAAHPPVVAVVQFRRERTTSKEVPEMPDVRAEVERAYQTAAEVVQRGDLQHHYPHQVARHIIEAGKAHLVELGDPASAAGLAPVDPDGMAAAEDHPEDREAMLAGRGAYQAGEPRRAPGAHPRDRRSRAWLAGWDAAKREAEA